MENWQNLLSEVHKLLRQALVPQETFEATEAVSLKLVQYLKESSKTLNSIGESELGMFLDKVSALFTVYDFSSHQPTPEEVEKYLEQVSAVAETMIPNILNRKEAVTTEDKKVFEFLQGHIKQALTAKKW